MSPNEWQIAASRLVEGLRNEAPGDAAARLRALVELAEAEIKLHESRLDLPKQMLSLIEAGEGAATPVGVFLSVGHEGSREAIRSALADLIDQGRVIFTLDGKLRIAKEK